MTGKTDAPRFIHLAAGRLSDIMQQHAQGQLQRHGGAVLPQRVQHHQRMGVHVPLRVPLGRLRAADHAV